jgi:hypothetical protein
MPRLPSISISIVPQTPVTRQNTPEIRPEAPEIQPETHIPAPHQRSTRRNSLKGLPKYNEEQFGCGKCQCVTSSHANAGVADVEGAFMLEEEGVVKNRTRGYDGESGVFNF